MPSGQTFLRTGFTPLRFEREHCFHQAIFSVYNGIYTGVNGGIYRKSREARGCRLGTLFPSGDFGWCIYQHILSIVNADIYMNFREAVDALCASLSHEDVAKALGVSLQTVRQARLREDSAASRAPPKNWKAAIIRLAENRVSYYRKLIEKLRIAD